MAALPHPPGACPAAAMPDPGARRALLIVFATCCLVYGLGLGSFELVARGEPRYATVARNMLDTGDFVTPRINGMVYLDKPPLLHWMNALSMGTLGRTPFAFRLPVMLMAALCTTLVYGIARRLHGPRAGLCTALVLGSCALWFGMSRHSRFDLPLALFVTGSLWSCWWAAEGGRERRWWYLLAAGLMALGMLTKGPIAVVLVVAPLLLTLGLTRRLGALAHVPWAPCVLLFAALAAPWYIACERANPGYLAFFFGHENAWRITREAPVRQPWWHTFVFLLGGVMPWAPCVPGAVRRAWPGRRGLETPQGRWALLCLLWVAVTVAVYIPPPVKFIQYIIPAIPALALLMGPYVSADSRGSRVSLYCCAGLLLALGAGIGVMGARFLPEAGLPGALAPVWAGAGILGGLGVIVAVRRGRRVWAAAAIAAALIVPLEVTCPFIGRAAPYVMTEQPVIATALRHAKPGQPLVCYGVQPPSAQYYYRVGPLLMVGEPVSEYDYPGNIGHTEGLWWPMEREGEVIAAAPANIGLTKPKFWKQLQERWPGHVRLLEDCPPYVIFETVPER